MDLIPQHHGALLDADEFQQQFQRLLDRYTDDVLQVVTKIRAYHDGLRFCDRLDLLNTYYRNIGKESDVRYRFNDREILLFRLTMLDKLDYWDDYIRLFDEVRQTKIEPEYRVKRWRSYPCVFDVPYILQEDDENVFLHFLFLQRPRYDLIREKLAKHRTGEKTGNMRHRRQSELSEEEIHQRFLDAMDAMKYRLIFNIKI